MNDDTRWHGEFHAIDNVELLRQIAGAYETTCMDVLYMLEHTKEYAHLHGSEEGVVKAAAARLRWMLQARGREV